MSKTLWIVAGVAGVLWWKSRADEGEDSDEGGGLIDSIFGLFKLSPGQVNPVPYPAEKAGAAWLMGKAPKAPRAKSTSGGLFDNLADVAEDWYYNSPPGTPAPWASSSSGGTVAFDSDGDGEPDTSMPEEELF